MPHKVVPQDVALHEPVPHHEPAREVTAAEVFDIYIGSHHRLRRVVDEGMSRCDLSLTRTKALEHLRVHGPVNQRELAAVFGHAPRSITDLIDGLERDGLAVRKDDPSDRRAKLVEITPEGRAAVATGMAIHSKLIERIFGALDASDRAELARLLELLKTSSDSAAADISPAKPAPQSSPDPALNPPQNPPQN